MHKKYFVFLEVAVYVRSGVRVVQIFEPVAVVIDLQEEMGKNRVADYYTGIRLSDMYCSLRSSPVSAGHLSFLFLLVTRFYTI